MALHNLLSPSDIARLCGDSPHRRAFWSGRVVLLTGATGMLGSWMAHALVEAGADVVALLRDQSSRSLLFAGGTMDRITIVSGDLCDLALLRRMMAQYEPEFVFHLAAQTQVGAAYREPVATFESNIRGSYHLFEAARHTAALRGIVFASTDKAYGTQSALPYTEEAPLQGEYPYDVSKSCADLIARCYHLTYQLPVCTTRCGNLYGPGDRNFARLIPGTIRSILGREQPVIRSDGRFVRDYLFTPDAVDGYLTLAESMERAGIAGEAFNLSTGNKLSVLELYELLARLLGSDARPKILNEAVAEIREQYLSSEKAQRLLGWKPRHSLEEGLRITAEWYQRFFASAPGRAALLKAAQARLA